MTSRQSWDAPLKVVVAGQGYVGLPVAMRAVEVGHEVVGLELSPARLGMLQRAESYIDDISSAQLATAASTGRYTASDDYADAARFDVAIITVPTPLRDRAPDLSFVEAAADGIGAQLGRGALVILESTTYPGTTEEVVIPILEKRSGLTAGRDFLVAYSPERIDPGNARWGLVNTPKVVAGLDEASLRAVTAFYEGLIETVVPTRGLREAELTKVLENTFRHVNIGLINEFAMMAHGLGIDIWDTIAAASTKPFGFMRFTPGPGVGGHCLPVDPTYISWRVEQRLGTSFRFVQLANDVNDHMPAHVVQRITAALNRDRMAVNGARILLVGLAYKPGSGDTREAPSRAVISGLRSLGAEVSAYDRWVRDDNWPADVERVVLTELPQRSWDVTVVLTDHPGEPAEILLRTSSRVLDTRHTLAGPHVEYL